MAFYHVRDIPELLIRGREREYFTWFIKNEAYDPTSISDDAIDEYVTHYSQPGGIRSMCSFYRATKENTAQNRESAKEKLTCPVLAVGGEAFIGRQVNHQMDLVAHNVLYEELPFGHQLAEECPHDLAQVYLRFLDYIIG